MGPFYVVKARLKIDELLRGILERSLPGEQPIVVRNIAFHIATVEGFGEEKGRFHIVAPLKLSATRSNRVEAFREFFDGLVAAESFEQLAGS